MFYLGTWQLSKISNSQAQQILRTIDTWGCGIDTALVYGNTEVEELLGLNLMQSHRIVSKIPANLKPDLDSSVLFADVYSIHQATHQIKEIIIRLKEQKINTILLHNWTYLWENKPSVCVLFLQDLKKTFPTIQFGISLPNNYNGQLHTCSELLTTIAVIEAPSNSENTYIDSHYKKFVDENIEVILRSFLQSGKDKNQARTILINKIAWAKECRLSYTVGISDVCQLDKNMLQP